MSSPYLVPGPRGLALIRDMRSRGVALSFLGMTALFVCSPLAEKITGEIIHIDGGYNILGMTLRRPAN